MTPPDFPLPAATGGLYGGADQPPLGVTPADAGRADNGGVGRLGPHGGAQTNPDIPAGTPGLTNANFHLIIDSRPHMVWVIDGGTEFFNRQALAHKGRPDGPSANSAWLGLVHPDDVGLRLRRFDGACLCYAFHGVPVHNDCDRVDH